MKIEMTDPRDAFYLYHREPLFPLHSYGGLEAAGDSCIISRLETYNYIIHVQRDAPVIDSDQPWGQCGDGYQCTMHRSNLNKPILIRDSGGRLLLAGLSRENKEIAELQHLDDSGEILSVLKCERPPTFNRWLHIDAYENNAFFLDKRRQPTNPIIVAYRPNNPAYSIPLFDAPRPSDRYIVSSCIGAEGVGKPDLVHFFWHLSSGKRGLTTISLENFEVDRKTFSDEFEQRSLLTDGHPRANTVAYMYDHILVGSRDTSNCKSCIILNEHSLDGENRNVTYRIPIKSGLIVHDLQACNGRIYILASQATSAPGEQSLVAIVYSGRGSPTLEHEILSHYKQDADTVFCRPRLAVQEDHFVVSLALKASPRVYLTRKFHWRGLPA